VNAPDFAAIIDDWDSLRPEDLLAAKVPEACQHIAEWERVPGEKDPCPDCPTIATLLAYGWNVATAEHRLVPSHSGMTRGLALGANAMIDALRTVEVAT